LNIISCFAIQICGAAKSDFVQHGAFVNGNINMQFDHLMLALFWTAFCVIHSVLLSLTERRREIGLRRALGARRAYILFQFLVESITLSLCGGIVGVIVGIAVTFIMSHFAGWNAVLSGKTLLLSVASSAAIGAAFRDDSCPQSVLCKSRAFIANGMRSDHSSSRHEYCLQ
jgi:hypothetical protein